MKGSTSDWWDFGLEGSPSWRVLDGGLATLLERLGANLDDSLWSAKLLLENPELIKKAHMAFLEAGADIIETSSYQATFPGFAARGLSTTEAAALFARSVSLAKEARDEFWAKEANRRGRLRPLIAVSIGPYGAYLHDGSEYVGKYNLTKQQLKDFHRDRIAALLAPTPPRPIPTATATESLAEEKGKGRATEEEGNRPDVLAFETIPCLIEGEAIVELMKEEFPDTKFWLSFSCKDKTSCCAGDSFVDCARLGDQWAGVVAVGINCTSPFLIEPLLRSVLGKVQKPRIVYPNSGEIFSVEGSTWLSTPTSLQSGSIAELVGMWRAAGASIIGGCCRTYPEDIAAIRQALERL